MILELDLHYRIESDSNNYILKYEESKEVVKKGETKEITSKDEWFYSSLSQALNKYMNQSLKASSTALEIKEQLNYIENIIKSIK